MKLSTEPRMATWLELTLCSLKHEQAVTYRLHEIKMGSGGNSSNLQCFAISMNGRWLCSTNGRLTVFQGRDSAERFMQLLNVSTLEAGVPLDSFPTSTPGTDPISVAGEACTKDDPLIGSKPLICRRLN